ncbi:hypothetical protein, partial [Campylobacter sp. CNRCH_2015_0814]|uniref:hypothetical protein n=1 Tax=Campylobacter sp. CNRCH_2015_0814 TaxID=2911606 RepID=UPI0021E68F62
VIITKTGTINANRFVASTSSLKPEDFDKFKAQGASFSPVFKPNGGNVVNMGTINANDVLLIGNKVDIQGGKLGNEKSTTHLVGKNVYIDADSTNLNSTINVTATEGGYLQKQMINFANNNYSFGDNVKVNVVNYKDSSGTTHIGSSNFKKALTMGNMGDEKKNAIEWWHFAKGWNEGLGDIKNVDEFRLVGNIDFSGNKGYGIEGEDWQNYANYWVDLNGDGVKQDNEFTNMIVGNFLEPFTKTFDGQGFTLKNINILQAKTDWFHLTGIFGMADGAKFKNINVDYKGGSIIASTAAVGGFIGFALNEVIFDNIVLSNLSKVEASSTSSIDIGGFIGSGFNGKFTNIIINNMGTINTDASYTTLAGGFAGYFDNGEFSNICIDSPVVIHSSDNFVGENEGGTKIGGFIGSGDENKFKNIALNGVKISIKKSRRSFVGGFIGGTQKNGYYENIYLKNGIYINGAVTYAGGFIGGNGFFGNKIENNMFKNIFIFFNQHDKIENSDGKFFGGSNFLIGENNTFDNIHIYHHEDDLTNAIADQNYWNDFNKNGYISDKINIHTYNDSTQSDAYKDFLSKANTIEKPSKPTDPTDPTDPNVILDTDDIISEDIINQIISELKDKFYAVDINTLNDLLKAYAKIDKDNPASKAEFLANYLLSKDKYPNKEKRLDIARSMVQSLDFLLAYTKNNIDESKLTAEAKDLYSKNR